MAHSAPPIFSRPLDRAALTTMLVLGALICILLLWGDHTLPKVRDFSWQQRQVGAEDRAFVLSFNRLMNWQSVTENLRISPSLQGKTSWAGRRLAYTLEQPIPYGQRFEVSLARAVAESGQDPSQKPKAIQPFAGQFRSRDRAYAYIGIGQGEEGRLVLHNLTRNQKTVLTPPDLVVSDFKPYTEGDQILFSATQRTPGQPRFDPQLYVVSTGLQVHPPDAPPTPKDPAGKIRLLLDNQEYQLLKFDLSADGENIVIQRANKRTQGQTSLWLLRPGQPLHQLGTESGGDFLITPDSNTLVIAQGQGLAIAGLDTDSKSTLLDFLPQFGMALGFARDGSAAAMVKFNPDFTRSLYLVTHLGKQKQLLRTRGSILSAAFDPENRTLFCLLTKLLPGESYNEQPYLAAIDLNTRQLTPLIDLPGQKDLSISLAPDGSGLIFAQVVTVPSPKGQPQPAGPGAAISTSQLWMVPIQPQSAASPLKVFPPQPLEIGIQARWLP
jgi:hypothetical protein